MYEGITTSMFTDLCLQKHVILHMPVIQASMNQRKALLGAFPSLSPAGPQDLCFSLGGRSTQCSLHSVGLWFVWHGESWPPFSFTLSWEIPASSLTNPGASKPRLAEGSTAVHKTSRQHWLCTRTLSLCVVTTGHQDCVW